MKARLAWERNKFYLQKKNGEIILVAYDEARDFLLNYSSDKYSGSDDSAAFGTPIRQEDGLTVATVEDNGKLIVHDPALFREVIIKGQYQLLTSVEFAKKHGKTESMVRRLCREGKIPEHVKIGNSYFIPENLPYPGKGN